MLLDNLIWGHSHTVSAVSPARGLPFFPPHFQKASHLPLSGRKGKELSPSRPSFHAFNEKK